MNAHQKIMVMVEKADKAAELLSEAEARLKAAGLMQTLDVVEKAHAFVSSIIDIAAKAEGNEATK